VTAFSVAAIRMAKPEIRDMDRDVLRTLSHTADYYAFERQLRPFLTVADPPLDRIGSIWAVRAPMDAFLNDRRNPAHSRHPLWNI
jgi:hypothetical protein